MFKAVSGSTEFPSIEEANLAFWEQNGTFQKSLQNRKGNPEFLFYDGSSCSMTGLRSPPACRTTATSSPARSRT